jgi:short-subunit dehydrogenase
MPIALITGASRGIGRELSLGLARRGYDLLLVARSEDQLRELAQQVETTYQRQAHVLALDLTQPEAASQVATWAAKHAPNGLTVLVNNAGYGLWGRFEKLNLEEQLNMLQLNLNLPVQLTYALLPQLRLAGRGYLLNIASTAIKQCLLFRCTQPAKPFCSASAGGCATSSRVPVSPLPASALVLPPPTLVIVPAWALSCKQ